MERNYKGLIFTNHALQRMTERGIKQGDAWATFRRPDSNRYAKSKRAWIYYKTYGNRRVEVVASKNERGEWVVISVWDKEVFGDQVKPKKKSLLKRFLDFFLI